MTDKQRAFLNDMGVMPDVLQGLTYGEASAMIDAHRADFDQVCIIGTALLAAHALAQR